MSKGKPYVHPDYSPGDVVFISKKYLKNHLGGKVVKVTFGILHCVLGKFNIPFVKVPVFWNGRTYYVPVEFISTVSLEDLGIAPTLEGRKHGYGCGCYSCVSQIKD